jgi:hypothetical protein
MYLNGLEMFTSQDGLAYPGYLGILINNVEATNNESTCSYGTIWLYDFS